jgi:hypothetical protein
MKSYVESGAKLAPVNRLARALYQSAAAIRVVHQRMRGYTAIDAALPLRYAALGATTIEESGAAVAFMQGTDEKLKMEKPDRIAPRCS